MITFNHCTSVGPGSAIEIDDRKESHFRIKINGCHRTWPADRGRLTVVDESVLHRSFKVVTAVGNHVAAVKL